MYLRLTLGVFVIMMTSIVDIDSVNMTEMMTAFLPVSEHIENEACRRDSLAIVQGVKNFELWALRMVDSSAKLPSGVLQGNIKSLGQYDECVETMTNDFSGQYCLASIHLNPLAGAKQHVTTLLDVATLGRRDREVTANRSYLPVPDLLPSLSLVQLGVCVPSSCSPRDVEVALSMGLQDVAWNMGLSVSAEVPAGYCSTLKSQTFDVADKIMLGVIGLLLLLTLEGTALDLMIIDKSQMNKLQRSLLAFSAPSNWNRLVKMDMPPAGSFTSLDGIRVLSTLWVIIGHLVILFPQEPYANKYLILEGIKDFKNMIFANNMPSVESFFLMAGMLRALIFLQQLKRNNFRFFNDAWRRYLRLTPPFAAMVFFYATLLPRLSNGPMWAKFIEQLSGACRDNWPYSLFYLNNYFHFNTHCIMQSWYLAADMHFYLLAPLLLAPIWKWPKLASPLFLGSIFISMAIPFSYTLSTESLPTLMLAAEDNKIAMYLNNIHIVSHNRAAAYIVGLALGYIIYKTDFSKLKLQKVTVVCGWTLSLALLYGVLFGAYDIMQFNHGYHPLESALYGTLHRPAWALGLAWLIFACHAGYGGWINRFLSARLFQPLSRLSYCFFLTHYAVLMFGAGRTKGTKLFYEYDLYRGLFADICVSMVCALVLHLLVEAPSQELVKLFYSKAVAVNSKSSELKAAPNTHDKKIKQG